MRAPRVKLKAEPASVEFGGYGLAARGNGALTRLQRTLHRQRKL